MKRNEWNYRTASSYGTNKQKSTKSQRIKQTILLRFQKYIIKTIA